MPPLSEVGIPSRSCVREDDALSPIRSLREMSRECGGRRGLPLFKGRILGSRGDLGERRGFSVRIPEARGTPGHNPRKCLEGVFRKYEIESEERREVEEEI